jgi:hypothetical protein
MYSLNIFLFTNAVCAIENYVSLLLLVARISVKDHMVLVILIYSFN